MALRLLVPTPDGFVISSARQSDMPEATTEAYVRGVVNHTKM